MVDTPTADNLKARYPEFASVADARVTLFLVEASSRVDSTWREADQAPAIIALACHEMSLEGEPAASISGSATGGASLANGRFLKSRSVGDVSNEWSESAASAAAASKSATASQAGYRSTPYGAKYLKLLSLNRPGMAVV
jgi:hypothetical protein